MRIRMTDNNESKEGEKGMKNVRGRVSENKN
jgi:hypothetical protein